MRVGKDIGSITVARGIRLLLHAKSLHTDQLRYRLSAMAQESFESCDRLY